jgi:hypothetical protein
MIIGIILRNATADTTPCRLTKRSSAASSPGPPPPSRAGKGSEKRSNHFFLDCFNIKKRTTTSNECRHRNIKYGEDKVGPNNSLAQSGGTQNAKRKAATSRKQSKEARNLTAASLWGQGIDHVFPEAGRLFFGEYQSREAYVSARIDCSTWLVMCPDPEPLGNPMEPQIHRCRTVKLIDPAKPQNAHSMLQSSGPPRVCDGLVGRSRRSQDQDLPPTRRKPQGTCSTNEE